MIIIIIKKIITIFMQVIYNYIPETKHVSRVQGVAAVVHLQFVLHVVLLSPRRMFCTFTLALSIVRVPCPLWLYFVVHNFMLSFMLLRYFLGDFEMVSVAPVITGTTFAFTFHMRMNFYYEIFYILKSSQLLS